MKPTWSLGQRICYAAGLILAMTSVFAVFSGFIWVIVTAWRAIIGN
mgnify:FL=1|jgi:hypothetical protein